MSWKSPGFDQYNEERIRELNSELQRLAQRPHHEDRHHQYQQQAPAHPAGAR